MDLVLVLIAGWALRSAWQHVTGRLGESRQERMAEVAKKFPQGMSKAQKRVTAARHDAGWWLREASHGFPVARTGWHTGWLAHKTAAMHQRAIRDKARKQHQAVIDSLADAVRKEGQENVAAIEAATAGQAPRQARATAARVIQFPKRPQPQEGQEAIGTAPQPAPGQVLPADEPAPGPEWWIAAKAGRCSHGGHDDPDGTGEICTDAPPEDDLPDDDPSGGRYAPGAFPVMDDPWPTGVPHRRKSDASPQTPQGAQPVGTTEDTPQDHDWATDPFRDLDNSSPYYNPSKYEYATEEERAKMRAARDARNGGAESMEWPVVTSNSESPLTIRAGTANGTTTNGVTPVTSPTAPAATDATYDGTQRELSTMALKIEAAINDIRIQQVQNQIEQVAAVVSDTQTISDLADTADQLQHAKEALKLALDKTLDAKNRLRRNHGGMNEAHQNAPVKGAQPEFYEG